MASRRKSRVFAAASLTLFLALLCAAPEKDRANLYRGEVLAGSFQEFQVLDDTVFLPLHESARALGIEGFADRRSRSVFFRDRGKLIFIDTDKKTARSADQSLDLKHAPIWTEDEVFVPHQVYTMLLSGMVGDPLRVEVAGDAPVTYGDAAPAESSGGTVEGSVLRNPVDVIVIDPGHGGEDAGARGPGGILEKDVTLAIARKLRDRLLLEACLSVHMTRDSDVFLPLSDRPKKARELHADIFVSIHANGFKQMSAQGFETFFASLTATDKAAMDLATRENQAGDTTGRAPDSVMNDLEMILGDMAQTESLSESQALSEKIQEELSRVMKSDNRGVKQAPFRVLMDSAMPAVLVEVGFLTSPAEARLITDPEMQKLIVEALARAVIEYRNQTNARLGLAPKEQP